MPQERVHERVVEQVAFPVLAVEEEIVEVIQTSACPRRADRGSPCRCKSGRGAAHCRLSRATGRERNQRRGPVHTPRHHHEGHRRTDRRRAAASEFSRVRRGEVD